MWFASHRAADAYPQPEDLPRDDGLLYFAVVIDLFSRRVVGWSMSDTTTAQFVTDALVMAIWRRGKPDALLHHSGQGSHTRASSSSGLWPTMA